MRRFFISILLLSVFAYKAEAQKNFFIYIESEAREPFYVLIDGKINYSSSLNGFLTIPQMTNGVYDAEIGFVKNKYPEQHFILSVRGEDLGFIIRKNKDATFGLLNLLTFATIAPVGGKAQTSAAEQSAPDNTSPFANKLKQTPNCIIATEADYISLRQQMAAAETDAKKIATAHEIFAVKCFSTEQVKNLSRLIASDKNKLIFFYAAKDCVYDSNNFGTLEGQLTDPAIIKQFRNIQ